MITKYTTLLFLLFVIMETLETETPRKSSKFCCVCGDVPKNKRSLSDKNRVGKNVNELLKKYGGVVITDGCMCRNCYYRLIKIDTMLTEFREKCQTTKSKLKRAPMHDITNNHSDQNLVWTPLSGSASVTDPEMTPLTPISCRQIKPKQVKRSLLDDSGFHTCSPENFLNDFRPDDLTETNKTFFPMSQLTSSMEHSYSKTDPTYGPGLALSATKAKFLSTPILKSRVEEPSTSDCNYNGLNQTSRPKRLFTSTPIIKARTEEPSTLTSTSDHNYIRVNQTSRSEVSPPLQTTGKSQIETTTCVTEEPSLTQFERKQVLLLINSGGLISQIGTLLLKNANFVSFITSYLITEYAKVIKTMNNEKHGFISVLRKKKFEDLVSFSWESVYKEFLDRFPLLANILEGMMKKDGAADGQKIQPKLSMIYAILAQSRHPKLSVVQRLTSICLLDNIADQKIYDRLQPLGLCLGYEQSQNLLKEIGQTFTQQLSSALTDGKRLCIVGDNVNYSIGIREQRKEDEGKTKTLNHAFASIALIHEPKFEHLSTEKPQKHWTQMQVDDLLLNKEEYSLLRDSYVFHIVKAVVKHIPFFKFLDDAIPSLDATDKNEENVTKTQVIPLETILKNEQNYSDVVDILDRYEDIIEDSYSAAGKKLTDNTKIHIGGDQLTRERFSGAKMLRGAEGSIKDKFGHLGPITFEMFHLLMNFLQLFFDFLYNEKSSSDLGTLKCEINRVMRTQVDSDVKKAYDADKDFVISFVDAYLVELICEWFGLEDHLSVATKNIPPDFSNLDEKIQWTRTAFGKIVDEMVWPKHNTAFDFTNQPQQSDVIEDGQFLPLKIKLANGKVISICSKKTKETKKKEDEDKVKNYAHLVLELGLLFKELVYVCKFPDQQLLLRVLKHSMTIFKAKSWNSKYAFEIHRFLIQQMCTLSQKESAEVVQGMFVNTNGKLGGCIPADLQMEYIVKTIKKHIKHMYSNKSEQNIANHTRGLSGVRDIGEKFDMSTNVTVRCKKHKKKSADGDELAMIEDLRKLKPFSFQAGRSHECFPNIKKSAVDCLNLTDYQNWIRSRIVINANDIGD